MPAGALRLVKVDVQGFECRVLRGMRAPLARHPDVVMMVEVFPLMTGGMTDVIVSRDEERPREVVSRWRGIPVKSTR